jgi:signal transduction histidine kinase/ActR/RegA family two-component response regulator
MSTTAVTPQEQRVLVLSPTNDPVSRNAGVRSDVAAIRSWLVEAGVTAEVISDPDDLRAALDAGAGGALILFEDSLTPGLYDMLRDRLARQPRWSDLPLLVIGAPGRDADAAVAIGLGAAAHPRDGANLTLVERPLHQATLTCAVYAALRARRRQYELRDLLAEADRALRQRDEFLAMLGHELRNPLGVISSAVQILNRVGSLSREAVETRDMIERQTSHLTRLVDDLLDVSRVSSGKIALRRELVELNEIARECFANCAAMIAAQGHELTLAPSPEPLVVQGDAVRLEQIVNNLLTNAIKYTPAGGRIVLSITRESDEGESPKAVVRVRDNGVGIEPDMLVRVFDMFTQADRPLDRTQGGVGLGLTLVRRLVEMHGGTVRASSAGIGKGSEFEVRLPLAATPAKHPSPGVPTEPATTTPRAAPPAGAARAAKPQAAVVPRHVLIVEDGPDARNALGRLLELWGHHVELAEDGTRGVERAIASHPEVALIDIGLPGLNGYEVARRVRQVLGDKIRLIALTGYGQPDDHARTREAGFDQHLVKPVNPKLLSRLLAETPAVSQPT